MPKDHLVCANPDCGHIFLPDRPNRVGGCCCKACARTLDAKKRNPGVDEKIAQAMITIDAELKRLFGTKP
jgi:hypothetical protein